MNEDYTCYMCPISFGDKQINDYLTIYEDRNKFEVLINILSFNFDFGCWQCIYSKILKNYGSVEMYNQNWNLTHSKVLVLYSPGVGSGGFISYIVLGKEDGQIVEYVKEDSIFGGSIFFKDTQLIRGTGNQFRVWTKDDEEFELKPYNMPIVPDATVIEYSILDENTVEINQDKYIIPINSKLQFIRQDFNDVKERTLITDNSSCLKFMTYGVFKVLCKGTITATIIPGGYNWDSAKEITIKVI